MGDLHPVIMKRRRSNGAAPHYRGSQPHAGSRSNDLPAVTAVNGTEADLTSHYEWVQTLMASGDAGELERMLNLLTSMAVLLGGGLTVGVRRMVTALAPWNLLLPLSLSLLAVTRTPHASGPSGLLFRRQAISANGRSCLRWVGSGNAPASIPGRHHCDPCPVRALPREPWSGWMLWLR